MELGAASKTKGREGRKGNRRPRSLRLELDRVRITHGFSCEPVPSVAAVIILVREMHDDFAHLSESAEPWFVPATMLQA
jgi:hypothetical protein